MDRVMWYWNRSTSAKVLLHNASATPVLGTSTSWPTANVLTDLLPLGHCNMLQQQQQNKVSPHCWSLQIKDYAYGFCWPCLSLHARHTPDNTRVDMLFHCNWRQASIMYRSTWSTEAVAAAQIRAGWCVLPKVIAAHFENVFLKGNPTSASYSFNRWCWPGADCVSDEGSKWPFQSRLLNDMYCPPVARFFSHSSQK